MSFTLFLFIFCADVLYGSLTDLCLFRFFWMHVISLIITNLELFLHKVVVEFYLADKASMFTATVQGLETLQNTINDK